MVKVEFFHWQLITFRCVKIIFSANKSVITSGYNKLIGVSELHESVQYQIPIQDLDV